jgi:hypothetical protein
MPLDCNSSSVTENFSLSAHVLDGTTTTGVGGTFNLSCSGGVNSGGNVVAKVDCLSVSGGGSTAQLSASVTHTDGLFIHTFTKTTEINVKVEDSGPTGAGDMIGWTTSFSGSPCGNNNSVMPLVHGNVNVHD